MKETHTVIETAKIAGISRRSVNDYIRDGGLKAVIIRGGPTEVRTDSLIEWAYREKLGLTQELIDYGREKGIIKPQDRSVSSNGHTNGSHANGNGASRLADKRNNILENLKGVDGENLRDLKERAKIAKDLEAIRIQKQKSGELVTRESVDTSLVLLGTSVRSAVENIQEGFDAVIEGMTPAEINRELYSRCQKCLKDLSELKWRLYQEQ